MRAWYNQRRKKEKKRRRRRWSTKMAVRSANGQSRDKISLCARTGAWGKESPRFGLIFRESCYHILLVAPSRLFPSLASFIPFHLRPLRPVSHFLLSRFSEPSSFVLPSRSPSSHRRLFAALVETGPLDSIVRCARHQAFLSFDAPPYNTYIRIARKRNIHAHIYLLVQVEIESSPFKHRQVLFNFKGR